MNKKYLYLITGIFLIGITFMSGTYAWLTWSTSSSQSTEVVFTIEDGFTCAADGGGNITSSDIVLIPTSCDNTEHVIKKEIKVMPTIYGDNQILMNLWLDINDIGTGLSNSQNLKYTLTTNPDSCTTDIVKTGNFYGKTTGDNVPLFSYIGYTTTTEETYYLYIWLDKEETSAETMNQSIDLSLNGICTNAPEPETYVVYTEEDTTLRMYKRDETSSISNNANSSIVSTLDNRNNNYNLNTIEDLTVNEDDKIYFDLEKTTYSSVEQLPWYEYRESITKVVIEDEIKPISILYWFSGMTNVTYMDLSNLNTSNITNMKGLFANVGYNATSFEIIGLDSWDTSKVTDMMYMFNLTGAKASKWNIGDISSWNTSSVTNMLSMFRGAAQSATTLNIGNLSEWDVSNVTDMSYMFEQFGLTSLTWELDLSNWNVSNVTSMNSIFNKMGANATTWSIGDLSRWDVSKVTNMNQMFDNTGTNATKWDIGDLSNWDTSNVTTMFAMFGSVGLNASTLEITGLNKWNTSNVTNMMSMFAGAGRFATKFDIGDLSNWNVSKVTNMSYMFNLAGQTSTEWSIGDISKWNTSSVTNMLSMFRGAVQKATYTLDLSVWNVTNVTSYGYFINEIGSNFYITPPTWVN